MKRIVWVLATLVALLAVLAGCGSTSKEESGKLRVVTTVFPVYEVARAVAGTTAEVSMLVPPGMEPHDWEPSAGDLKAIGNAQVFVYSGAGLEPTAMFLKDDIVGKAKVVELTKGLDLLPPPHEEDADEHEQGHEHDAVHEHEHEHEHDADKHEHEHEHDAVHEHEHEHDADEHEHGHHHHHGEFDPHVWLDPQRMMQETDILVAAFSEADPAHADEYRRNGEAYKAKLQALDAEMEEALSNLPRKEIVVAHEAFGYLVDRYGLTQLGIMGVAADAEPTPERMARLVEFIREHDVRTIYSEELINPKLAEALAKETGTQVRVLNPIEGLTKEQQEAGYDYIRLQRENMAALIEGQQ